jgi:hypothetical protein
MMIKLRTQHLAIKTMPSSLYSLSLPKASSATAGW